MSVSQNQKHGRKRALRKEKGKIEKKGKHG
jgi:hypothetical protein